MARTIGYETVEETIGEGSSLSSPITVEADSADTVYIYVDNGSGGAVSEAYTLDVEVEKGTDGGPAWFEETNISASGSNAKRHEGSTSGGTRLRVNITNETSAGSSQTYRVVVHARAEGAN